MQQYGIAVKESRGQLSYLPSGRAKFIRAKHLGDKFDKAAVLAALNANAERATQMNTDLANGESKIWILDDPEGFEQAYGALSEKLGAEWQTKLMPNVEESLNVRAQADEQSDIVGKLYKGSVADIVENDGTWAHIKSGNVDGYVNVSYCVTGTDALSYAYDRCGEIATVNTDGLRVREAADTNSKALEVADQGKTYQVDRAAQAQDGWIAVVCDSQTGYIAADYATRSLNTRVGITIEEEQAQIAAQKEAERKAAEEKAAKEAAKAAKESKKTETTQGEAVSAGADDLTLLAAIIECEAGGESYECQLAVGAAVINRVKSSSYPNSISGVIYQKGQFGPASSGKLARKLSGRISSSCYSAAQEAMSGVDNTGGCTSFNDHGSGISIGNMKFR